MSPSRVRSAAWRLTGQQLDGGWSVVERIEQDLDATGGAFSVGYVVKHPDGRNGFLKALDYSTALSSRDRPVSIVLQELTQSLNFEKYVLARCRDRRLDRIVISIADGTFGEGIDIVEYLIFELADGDVRSHMKVVQRTDVTWRLSCLHDIATGLTQLHSNDITHQDLKPSNVLVFRDRLSKIADFGRSSCRGQSPPHASQLFAGDWTYAPPEALYGFSIDDSNLRSLSFDAYLMGSMVIYLFTGQSMTALLLNELAPAFSDWQRFAGTPSEIKLHLAHAFASVLDSLSKELEILVKSEFARCGLLEVVAQLCEPDPLRRGHPRERRSANPFSLVRYRTKFDLLLKRAEIARFAS